MKIDIKILSLPGDFVSLVSGTEVTTFQKHVSRAVTGPFMTLCK